MHRYLSLVLAAAISSSALGEEIPLKSIWALDMPGTQDIRELDPRETKEQTAITKIASALMGRRERKENLGSCFLVSGEGKDALKNAAALFAGNAPPSKRVAAGEKVSLVFYACSAPGYVHLHSVSKEAGVVTIKYQVVMHQSLEVTSHFALIPLGKLSPGNLKIISEYVPREKREPMEGVSKPDLSMVRSAVCKSCSFEIVKEETPK